VSGVNPRLSILDRLLDAAPEAPADQPESAAELAARVRAALRRDVEALLNARRPWQSVPNHMPALRVSPLGFGLTDIAAGAFDDRHQREALRAEVEEILHRFEPRLTDLRVELTGEASTLRTSLSLRIDAVLNVDPVREAIRFDTVVETAPTAVTLLPQQGR
jgi:type VI secretion system protein ImpF